MKTLLLSAEVATGLAAAVLDAGTKTAILFLVAALVVATLRRASAATRHLVWTAAIICALLMPALSLLLPHWRVLPGWMGPPSPIRGAAPLTTRSLLRLEPAPRERQAGLREQPSSSLETPFFPAASRIDDPVAITSSGKRRPQIAFSSGGALLAGWAIGAALLFLPILRSAFSLRRLGRRFQIVRSGALAENLAAVAGQLKLRRNVALHVGAHDAMPMVWGVWHAHLLLPASAELWPGARLRAVLLHELAHLRRHDPLILLLGQVAWAAHWFNPLAWFALHRLRVEQERACDDYVLRAGIKPSEYADDVLDIATALHVGATTDSIALSMAAPSRLERRLRSIVGAALNRNALTRSAIAITLITSVAIALPLAMLRAADEKRDGSIATPAGATPPPIDPRSEELKKAYLFDSQFEREMASSDTRYLDLDRGLFVETHPPGDLFWALGESDLRVRAGLNMTAIAVPAEKWEMARAEEVLEAVSKATPQKQVWLGGSEPSLDGSSRRTWFFKTFEGGSGVLQIVPHNKRPGSVLVRHKLVRRARLFEYALIILSSAGPNRHLSLDTGRTLAAAPENAPTVYLLDDPKAGWVVRVENGYNYHTTREEGTKLWNSMTAEAIAEPAGLAAAPPELNGWYPLRPGTFPITVLIPQYGLVRVTGFDDRTKSVVLEYKRVVTPEITPPGATPGQNQRSDRRRVGEQQPQSKNAVPLAETDARVANISPNLLALGKETGKERTEPARVPVIEPAKGTTSPQDPRATVNEWLQHVGADRMDEMWALTTRESGMDTGVKDLDQFASIRARHALLGESAAMVVSTRFNDNAARPRALLFSLIRQGNHWRVRDVIQDSPENVQHRIEGFAAYPGVRFHVLPAEIVGDWTSGFLSRARHTFHLDGTGEVRDPQSLEPRRFRWELKGDLLRMRAGENVTEGKIVRVDHDLFAVRYPDGNQWGFHRAKATERRAPGGTSDEN